MPVLKRLGVNRANTYIAALGQLARHHRDWLRAVETWRPDTAKERPQFQALSRYLLARYEVPRPWTPLGSKGILRQPINNKNGSST